MTLVVCGILILEYLLLPAYVGYDNEHYIPDVRQEFIQKAKYTLNSLGFKSQVVTVPFSEKNTPGTVVKMSPRAFTKVKEGRTINLTVAGHRKDIIIPKFLKMSLRNAKINIERDGLALDTVIYEFSNNVKEGYVSFQVPKEGHVVKSGALITLGISRGNPPDYYIVPDLVGLSLGKAEDQLAQVGLRLGNLEYEHQPELLENTVIDQNFTAGMRVSFPAAIDLIISTEKEYQ